MLKIFYVAAHVFVMMECKKKLHFSTFAECCDHVTRQRIFFKKKIQTLPSAGQRALDKEFFLKKTQTLPSAGQGALGK